MLNRAETNMHEQRRIPMLAVVISALALAVAFARYQSPIQPSAQPTVVMYPVDHRNYSEHGRLTAAAVIGDEDTFGWISEIRVIGDIISVFDREPRQGAERLLLLDKHGKLRARLGPPGERPTDIGNTVSFGTIFGTDGSDFYVWDYRNRRASTFRVDGDDVRLTGTYMQPDRIPLFQLEWIKDDLVVTNGLFSEELLRFYAVDHRVGTLEFSHSAGRVLHPREAPPASRQLSRNMMATDPTAGRVAIAFSYVSRLHIYDSDGSLLRVVGGPEEVIPRYTIEGVRFIPDPGEGFRMAYIDLDATEDHIFGLFSGKGTRADEVHVFSWSGELVRVFGLDAAVDEVAVDARGSRLYAVQLQPFPTIRIYDLPVLTDVTDQ
jgi:hypothetical protein